MSAKDITLTINSVEVTAPEGTTIMLAALKAGIEIPHLCYDPDLGLVPTGSCRLCLVELEGAPAPVASCTYPIAQGMIVHTESDSLQTIRRNIIELLLSNHPADCHCTLEEYAYQLGMRERPEENLVPFLTEAPPDMESIAFDPERCILCGRCIQVCQRMQEAGAIDFYGRGFDAEISLPPGQTRVDSDCEWCGNCVSVCPTGALKALRMRALKQAEKVCTTCTYCGVGCQFDLNTLDGHIVGVTPHPDNPVNGRWLCVKGRFGYEFINHPDRLKTPLIRRNGELEPASWDEAMEFISSKMLDIKAKHGPDALAFMSSSRCTNEENYLMQKIARAAIGTNSVDQCARTCHAPTVAGLAMAFGSGAMTNSIAEIPFSTVIFMIGANPTEAHPIIGLKIKEAVRNGAKLIVIDPRKIWLTKIADVHIPIKPGTDLALINAVAHTILEEGLEDGGFINSRTEGFEEWREIVSEWSPERAAEVCEVSADDIRKAARMYATAARGSIIYTLGITEHTCGTRNVLGLANLAMLTGQIGRESTGVNPLRGQNNVQGACDMGALPDTYPGYQKVAVEANRVKFEQAWGVKLPQAQGMMITDMLDAAYEGKLKSLYILGEDPIMSESHATYVRQCLEKLDLLVVQEMFLNETAKMADVVLPASCFAEKDGTFTNTERRVQRVRKAGNLPGEAREDWKILVDLSNRLGYKMSYGSPSEIWDEVSSLSPPFGGISYARIDNQGIQFPCTDENHQGTKYLHCDKFTRGLGKFHPVFHTPPKEVTDAEYPFLLSTGRTLYHYNVGTMTRRVSSIHKKSPENFVEINPRDLEKMGASDGQMLRISTRRGSILAKATATDKVKKGRIWMPFHFAEQPTNVLTVDAYDDITKTAEYKVAAAAVEIA